MMTVYVIRCDCCTPNSWPFFTTSEEAFAYIERRSDAAGLQVWELNFEERRLSPLD